MTIPTPWRGLNFRKAIGGAIGSLFDSDPAEAGRHEGRAGHDRRRR